jgi:hypothetical protein
VTTPLQVYLDSSDYSVLSDEDPAPELHALLAYLESRVESGDIEIRYSYPLVSEAAPVKPKHIEASRRRFQMMARLCGRRCFANLLQLWEAEARGNLAESIYSDRGDWFPPVAQLDTPLTSPAEAIEASIADSGLNRHSRRKLSARYVNNGVPTAAGWERLKSPSPRFVEKIIAKYPFHREQVESAIREHGWLSPQLVARLLTESFRDLDNFDQWFAKAWNRAESVSKWIRSGGERIERILLDSKVGIQEHRASAVAKGVDLKKMERVIASRTPSPGATIADRVLVSARQRLNIEHGSISTNWTDTPSLCTVGELASALLQDTSFAMDARRKARKSDAGDVLHAGYLPFVDIFRADGYMTTLIGSCKLPVKAKVVGSIHMLRPAIEAALILPERAAERYGGQVTCLLK